MSENPLRCPRCHLCNLRFVWGEWKCISCGYVVSSGTQGFKKPVILSQEEKTFFDNEPKAAHGDYESMTKIVALLNCNDSNLQRKIESFLLQNKQYSIDIVLDALKSSSHKKKDVLIKLLGDFREPKVVRPLILLLKKSPIEIKKQVIQSLGIIGDKKAVVPLIQQLKDGDLTLKQYSIEALLLIDDERAIFPILNELDKESDEICGFFFKYLRNKPKLVDKIISDKETTLKLWQFSLRLLDSEDLSLVISVTELLQKLIPFSSIHLTETIDDAPRKARCEIIGLLGDIYDERSVDCLLKQITTSEQDIQNKSVHSLIKNKKTLSIMKKFHKAQNFEPIEAIISAFLRSKDEATTEDFEVLLIKLKAFSVHQLIQKLDGSPARMKCKIIHLLSKIGVDEIPIEMLIQQLSICSETEKIKTIRALGKNKNIRASEPLINLLEISNDRNVQNACVDSIIMINDASTVPLLTKLLNSSDNHIRKNAETILIGLHVPKKSDELIEQRQKAIKEKNRLRIEQERQNEEKKRIKHGRIKQYDPKVNDPTIIKILNDSKSRDRKLRRKAISSLKYINSHEATAALIRISNYRDPMARDLAKRILEKRK